MKIVVDTNVVISGVFFGGCPRKVLSGILTGRHTACVSEEIIDEYKAVVKEMIVRKQGHLDVNILNPLLCQMKLINVVSKIDVCRDPDDNKFLECAKDGKAIFIVSGDKDLLVLRHYAGAEILTAREFCEKYC